MATATNRIAVPTAAVSHSMDEIADVYSKVTWRLIPFLFVCYVASYLDRINIGFAQLQMKQDLGFSDAVYGLGAGIFFFGYFLFEVPSVVALRARLGVPSSLREIGMKESDLDSAARLATDAPYPNPRSYDTAQVRRLLDEAYRGELP